MHKTKLPQWNPVHVHFNLLCSSRLVLSSDHEQSYWRDDGQTDDCVAGAVDLWNFEAFAHIPALIR